MRSFQAASDRSYLRRLALRIFAAVVFLAGAILFLGGRSRPRVLAPHVCVRSDLRTQYRFVVDRAWTDANSLRATIGTTIHVTTELTRQIVDTNGGKRWVPLPNHRVTIGTADSAPNPDVFKRLTTDEGGRAHFNLRRDFPSNEQLISKIVYCQQTYEQCLKSNGGTTRRCFLGPTDEAIDESGKSPELGVVANLAWIVPG
jgi:hypothetical protein